MSSSRRVGSADLMIVLAGLAAAADVPRVHDGGEPEPMQVICYRIQPAAAVHAATPDGRTPGT